MAGALLEIFPGISVFRIPWQVMDGFRQMGLGILMGLGLLMGLIGRPR